jgi:phage gp46-like protein
MPSFAEDLSIKIDGVESSLLALEQPLVRAVVISLFTWRRAQPTDPTEGVRWGWWADGLDGQSGDRIGSRLWLLSREKIKADTLKRAREYAQEALQWLLDDGVATAVQVDAERLGLDGVALSVLITRDGAPSLALRFDNAWSVLKNA